MFISVRNRPLTRQHYPTSCWISAAHYVLQYLNQPVTLLQLEAQYYRRDQNALLAMSGAGHPRKIINTYSFDTSRVAVTMQIGKVIDGNVIRQSEKADVIAAIAGNLREGIPVIAAIRSQDVRGFGHALLITGIEEDTGTVIFKDPGARTGTGPFAIDVRSQSYESFTSRFAYAYARAMNLHVTAYCSEITYLKDWSSISLFD